MTTKNSAWKAWWGRPGWERFLHVAAAATFLIAVGIFLELADDAPEGDYLPIETKIMQGMRDAGKPLGPAGTATVVRDITSMGGGQLLNLTLKHAFARERPDTALHLVEVTSTSFPSGHSMASSIFYLTMGVLLARTAQRRREKAYFVGSAIMITFLIGFSRVYLGVHYPTDVLAGWSAGTAWAMVCWFVADWLGRRGKLRKETGEVRTV
jgi:undecaprenyl-diphosphatase